MNLSLNIPLKIYGVKLKDKNKVNESQSGGAFSAIAEAFLKEGAIVYGCSMNSENEAVYSRIDNIDRLNEIKGSKYVQARLDETFISVIKDLKNGYKVLFSGTPCYVSAIKKLASIKDCDNNLYTVDLICHGVPSPLVYRTYLNELSSIKKSKVAKFVFRDKNCGWSNHLEKVIYDNGIEEIRNDYVNLFYTNLSLRPSCGKCKFARTERVSDFTVADFWGVKKFYPSFYDDSGVSVIFCNNEWANYFFLNIKNDIDYIETELDYMQQPNLQQPSKIPFLEKLFWRDFKKKGMLYCSKKWSLIIESPNLIKYRIKNFIKNNR